jgi:molybdopterin adenylyltransferase
VVGIFTISTLAMTSLPHPDIAGLSIACAVITISDTRTPATDQSGQLIQNLLRAAGHQIVIYQIIPDEPTQIQELLTILSQNQSLQAVIFNGGTGIAPRDTTYDALAGLLEKTLPGFGEIFRSLSYAEIGSRAIASRAVAGTYQKLLIFSLPGSRGAVELGVSKIILPEINHLVKQLQG